MQSCEIFGCGSTKKIRIDDTIFKAIIPLFWQDITVFN